jgi:CDP-paratose 2-epimerase
MMESIELSEKNAGRKLNRTYKEENRTGDHIWWISDTSKFSQDYPAWKQRYNVTAILQQIFENSMERWAAAVV